MSTLKTYDLISINACLNPDEKNVTHRLVHLIKSSTNDICTDFLDNMLYTDNSTELSKPYGVVGDLGPLLHLMSSALRS